MAIIPIGIDFGTTFIYTGFVHGTEEDGSLRVEELIPVKERARGIPSLYYRDGDTELFGREAELAGRRKPECLVSSVKQKLAEKTLTIGRQNPVTMPVAEIIQRMLRYVLGLAETILNDNYIITAEAFDVVLTVPVDYDAAQLRLMRSLLDGLKLKSGVSVRRILIVQEPVASAVRFLGIRHDPEEYAAVFDLGGGTMDVAIVHDEPNGDSPYRVVDQGGDRELGGDDWDRRTEKLLRDRFRELTGQEPDRRAAQQIEQNARDVKEDLSEAESVSIDLMCADEDVELTLTRQELEAASADLCDRAIEQLAEVLRRQHGTAIKYLILTGGSCRMPQIRKALAREGLLPEGIEIRAFRPERAVAEGAAVLAYYFSQTDMPDPRQVQNKPTVQQIAPHGCGVLVRVPSRGDELMIRILFRKGAQLPVAGKIRSETVQPESGTQRPSAFFTICETDVMQEGTDPYAPDTYIIIEGDAYTSPVNGREVFDAELLLPADTPAGTEIEQQILMDESLLLNFAANDVMQRANLLCEIKLSGI